jgi:hypothetical protein
MRLPIILIVALLVSACVPVQTRLGPFTDPVSELKRVRKRAGNYWLATMQGAAGFDIHELPGGDALVAGASRAPTHFVQRLAADGSPRWALQIVTCGDLRMAAADDELTQYMFLARLPPPGE